MGTKIKIAIIVDKFSPVIGGPYFILKQTVNSLKKIINIKLIFNESGKLQAWAINNAAKVIYMFVPSKLNE